MEKQSRSYDVNYDWRYSVPVLDNDGTMLLFTIMLGILLLTEKENCILNWRD